MDKSCGVGHLGFSIYTEYEILQIIKCVFMHHLQVSWNSNRQKKQPSNQNSSKNNFTYFPIRSNIKTVSLGGSHVGFPIHNKHKLFRRLFKEHFHHTTIQSYRYMWFLKIKYFKFEPIGKHYWPSSHLEIWKEKKSHPGQVGFRLIQ